MIEIDNITKIYASARAVDGVSMTIDTGTITVIVGTSGSGKTTLLRLINRLEEPTSGEVRINGQSTLDVKPHILRRRIGYAIQGHGLFPHHTVARNIGAVPQLLGWTRDKIDARVDELLDLFSMAPQEFRHRYPTELSGGQQQRVGVARALASRPDLILMDEPFGALDPIIRTRAQEDLRRIQQALGSTIILVTHDMEEAIRLGDRVAVMDGGKLVQHANRFSDKELRNALRCLHDTDVRLRGSGTPGQLLMENVIFELCEPLDTKKRRASPAVTRAPYG